MFLATVIVSSACPGAIDTISMPRPRLAASSAHMASAQAWASCCAFIDASIVIPWSAFAAAEVGRALFHEGAHALGIVGRVAGLALQVALEIELLIDGVGL